MFTSSLHVLKSIAECILKHRGRSIEELTVIGDFLFVGPPEVLRAMVAVLTTLWGLRGFESSPDKRWEWSSAKATRWLGATWRWDTVTGELSMSRRLLLADPVQVYAAA